MPTARDLRDRVTFQRRTVQASDMGGVRGDWATLIDSRSAMLQPMRPRRTGGEEVIAARLQGVAIWDLWVRFDSLTRTVTVEDRVLDARDATRVFDIKFAEDLERRHQWMFFQLQLGTATG